MLESEPTLVLNGAQEAPKCIIVCGLARSGTSAAALVLIQLGVNMGETLTKGSHEDRQFFKAMQSGVDDFNQYVNSRSSTGLWGAKLTADLRSLTSSLTALPSPALLVPIRDFAAVTARRDKASQSDFADRVAQLSRQWARLQSLIENATCPVLLYSHRWAVSQPTSFVKWLCHSLQMSANDEAIGRAAAALASDQNDYTKNFELNHADDPNANSANDGVVSVGEPMAEGQKFLLDGMDSSDAVPDGFVRLNASMKALSRHAVSGKMSLVAHLIDDPLQEATTRDWNGLCTAAQRQLRLWRGLSNAGTPALYVSKEKMHLAVNHPSVVRQGIVLMNEQSQKVVDL